MKNQRTTVDIEQKLDVIIGLQKGERIVDIWHNVRFAHSSTCTIYGNADWFTESAKSGPKLFV